MKLFINIISVPDEIHKSVQPFVLLQALIK